MYVCSCVCLQMQHAMESPSTGVTCSYEQPKVSSGIWCWGLWKNSTSSLTLNHIDSGRYVLFLNHMYVLDALLCFEYKYIVGLYKFIFSKMCNTLYNYIYNDKTTPTCKCPFCQCLTCSNNRFVKLALLISMKTCELWSPPIWSTHTLLWHPLVSSILSSLWPKAK